jgi:hypothetical protein
VFLIALVLQFRGICGGQLPRAFYTPNIFNVKGGIEKAFMSTTTELKVAAEFAASGVGGKIGVVYEMQMGMIDRYVFVVYLVHSFYL